MNSNGCLKNSITCQIPNSHFKHTPHRDSEQNLNLASSEDSLARKGSVVRPIGLRPTSNHTNTSPVPLPVVSRLKDIH
ncbi:hypothetical protein PM082_017301 [Marasmius tenuissimus]|nr:hypothetical protein PM082_017301 [Marasmius tenuissimus]